VVESFHTPKREMDLNSPINTNRIKRRINHPGLDGRKLRMKERGQEGGVEVKRL
jgi:hypothetical protein